MSDVSIRDLSIQFGANEVISNLCLDVESGEFLVLLGPSGCGKSTLLHSIAGLNEVSKGEIFIDGQEMTYAEPSQRGIGMVFQSYALYPTMTVERNMSFGLRVAGLPKEEVKQRIQRVGQMLQLEQLLDRKPSQLSGGQRQRVAIGRALVREAHVFLFDEPLSNLDAKLRTELRRELKDLHRQLGSTMIYVTHDQVEAMTLASRIVVMRAGRIQQIGTPSEVYDKPSNLFVAGFLGSPGMNLVAGHLTTNESSQTFNSPELSVSDLRYPIATDAPGSVSSVILGFRPEHIQIKSQGEFGGKVQLVEPMGNHSVVWIRCGDISLAAVVQERCELVSDQSLRFDIDRNRISLFDSTSEQRL